MVFAAFSRFSCVVSSSSSLDNFVYKLCYRWTVLLLVVFSFVVSCKLIIRDSFFCTPNNQLPITYVNAKCYYDSTYTLPAKLIIPKNGTSAIEPSVESFKRYYPYYSRVNLLLLIHAFNFYLPHLLWKSFDRGYENKLTAGVQNYFDKKEKRGLELRFLAKYVIITQGKHKLYTSLYILFEVFNCIISLAQTLWLVQFFNVTGVPDFLPFALETWADFRQFYFPPSGICEMRMPSASGSTIRTNSMCDMPLNDMFMNMFLFLHSWYIFLTILTGMVLLYRIALLVPSFRVFSAKLSANLAKRSVLKSLCNSMSYSDWFFLSRLRKSMTDVDFAQMLDKIITISQGKDVREDLENLSIIEERTADFESSDATSPL